MKNLTKLCRRRPVLVLVGAVSLTLSPACIISYSNTIKPAGIVIHHSALPYPPADPNDYLPLISQFHQKRGFGCFYWGRFFYVGYHYVILPDGRIQKGRPDRCRGAHAKGFNSYIGVCLVGDFSSTHNPTGSLGLRQPTEAQLQSLVGLCRGLMAKYAIPQENLVRHCDVNENTQCPGNNFPFAAFRRAFDDHPQ
jgi:hypothetical protein